MAGSHNYFKGIPELPDYAREKTKRPKLVAVVDEDNCTGCQVCVPFCPVDCIELIEMDTMHWTHAFIELSLIHN